MNNKKILIIGLIVSLSVVILLSPFASSKPDGLERVAKDKGFSNKSYNVLSKFVSVFEDYTVPFIKNEKLSTAIAGITGVLLVFIVSYLFAKVLRNKKNQG